MKQAAWLVVAAVLAAFWPGAARAEEEAPAGGSVRMAENTFDRWHMGFRVGTGMVVNARHMGREMSFDGGIFVQTPFLEPTTVKMEFSSDILLGNRGSETGDYNGVPFRADNERYLVNFKADFLVFPMYASLDAAGTVEPIQPYLLGGLGWMEPSITAHVDPHPFQQQIADQIEGVEGSVLLEVGGGCEFALGPRVLMDLRATYDFFVDQEVGSGVYAITLGLAY